MAPSSEQIELHKNATGNIYYNPENFNLEIIAEQQIGEASYDFDIRIVLRDKDSGALYMARDAGCSCPVPFENLSYSDLEDFSLSVLSIECGEYSDFMEKVRRVLTSTNKGK